MDWMIMNELQVTNNSNDIRARKIFDSLEVGDTITSLFNEIVTINTKRGYPEDPYYAINTSGLHNFIYGGREDKRKEWDKEFLSIKKVEPMNENKQELYYDLYTCYSIVKTLKEINKVDIINAIRGVEGVVTVDVDKKHHSKFLISPPEANYEKTLIKVKYLVVGDAIEEIMKIKADALHIKGLQQFLTIKRSITKL